MHPHERVSLTVFDAGDAALVLGTSAARHCGLVRNRRGAADGLGPFRLEKSRVIRESRLGFIQVMAAVPPHRLLDFATVLGLEPALFRQDIGEAGILTTHPLGIRTRKLIAIDHGLDDGERREQQAVVGFTGAGVEQSGHERKLGWVRRLWRPARY